MKTPDSITAPNLYDAGRTYDDRRVVTATKPSEPCHVISPNQGRWPFDKVPRATLMAAFDASNRICAAHYFPPFPLQVQNADPATEYYAAQWLNPAGESGTYSAQGGYLRQTPFRTAPIPDATTDAPDGYRVSHMRHEMRMLHMLGVNAVAADILESSSTNWDRIIRLYDILEEEYLGDMYALITPDLKTSLGTMSTADLGTLLDTLTDYNCAMTAPSGNFLIAPYGAEDADFSNADVVAIINEMTTTHSKAIDWMPIYNGFPSYIADLITDLDSAGLLSRLNAVGEWARGYVSGASDRIDDIAELANSATYGKALDFFMPVTAQVHRPKNPWYQGAQNLDTLFTFCEGMISGDPKHINIVTWNDYSEGTEFAPSSGTGFVIYDILAYYIQWWGMGTEPNISEDTLYYWYRKQLTTGVRSLTANDDLYDGAQSTAFSENAGIFDDKIEIVAFLKEAAVLEIEFNGRVYNKAVPAGVQRFKIDAAVGPAPVFRIRRNNIIAVELQGQHEIVDKYNIQDLLYYGGGSRLRQPAPYDAGTLFPSVPWRFGDYATSGVDATLLASEEQSIFPNKSYFPALRYESLDSGVTTGFGYSWMDVAETDGFEITFDVMIEDAPGGLRIVGEIYGATRSQPVHQLLFDVNAGQSSGYIAYFTGADNQIATIATDTWYRVVVTCPATDGSETLTFTVYEAGTGVEADVAGTVSGISPRNNQAAAVNAMAFRDSSSTGVMHIDNFDVVAL